MATIVTLLTRNHCTSSLILVHTVCEVRFSCQNLASCVSIIITVSAAYILFFLFFCICSISFKVLRSISSTRKRQTVAILGKIGAIVHSTFRYYFRGIQVICIIFITTCGVFQCYGSCPLPFIEDQTL